MEKKSQYQTKTEVSLYNKHHSCLLSMLKNHHKFYCLVNKEHKLQYGWEGLLICTGQQHQMSGSANAPFSSASSVDLLRFYPHHWPPAQLKLQLSSTEHYLATEEREY